MDYDATVWGPSYWFFLDNIAFNYPMFPNDVIKKKYYDLIQNLPLFIPHSKISSEFQKLLNLYPIKTYLDDKKSLIKWVHFIHNKINKKLEKPQIDIDTYYINHYKKYEKKTKPSKIKKYITFLIIVTLMISLGFIYYNK
jgi:hypothetical protein